MIISVEIAVGDSGRALKPNIAFSRWYCIFSRVTQESIGVMKRFSRFFLIAMVKKVYRSSMKI